MCIRDRRKGEAYALRALNLYYLLMNHGGWTADGKLLGVPNLTEMCIRDSFNSGAIGWTITEENFMKSLRDNHIIDMLKFRASYGAVSYTHLLR